MSDIFLPFEDERLPTTPYRDSWDQPIPGTDKLQKWRKLKVLGRGTYGTLRLVKGDDGSVRAVKEISRVTTPAVIGSRELHALIKLKLYPDHFVQFHGLWEDDDSIYFAMEYIEQGDLMNLITRQKLSEDDGRNIARQLVEGLKIMHRNHLCHRDLKPENILVVSSSPGPLRVKLADFGCAKFALGTRLRTEIGTEGYIAPEVLNYDDTDTFAYTFKADLWSLGCVLFYVLTKKRPLRGYKPYHQYTTGVLPFPSQELIDNNISPLGIQFITELMTPEHEKRLSASQALEHSWLIGATEIDPSHSLLTLNAGTAPDATADTPPLEQGNDTRKRKRGEVTSDGEEERRQKRRVNACDTHDGEPNPPFILVECHAASTAYEDLIAWPSRSMDTSENLYGAVGGEFVQGQRAHEVNIYYTGDHTLNPNLLYDYYDRRSLTAQDDFSYLFYSKK